MLNITSLNYADADFYRQLDELLAWDAAIDGEVAGIVADILSDVKQRGDEAVIEYFIQYRRNRCQLLDDNRLLSLS